MTFMGKVFVVLNVLMSFIFMAFAMLVYTTRVDLRGELAKKETQIAQVNREKQETLAKIAEVERALAAESQKLKQAEADRMVAEENLKRERDEQIAELRSLKEEHEKKLADFNVSTLEMNQRKKEIDQVREDRNTLIKANAQLTTDKGELQDKLSQMQNDLQQMTERNQQMASRVAQLEGYVVKVGNGQMPTAADLNAAANGPPPPPEVEGIVTNVDSTGRFIQLSLGEDDGLRKDQVLEVWRTKPEPKYLGKVKIFTTEATTSVAKPISVSGMIQPNDNVGPRIINRAN